MSYIDTFSTKKSFFIDEIEYNYFSLENIFEEFNVDPNKFPYSYKILIENILRNEDGINIKSSQIKNTITSFEQRKKDLEINFFPTRVLMQDFTGVPAIADLVSMRDAIIEKGIDAKLVNPRIPVDLIIDHSITVDSSAKRDSHQFNMKMEYNRNMERYKFLKWSQKSFDNLNVVPPGVGICHQVNLEKIAKTIWSKKINGTNYVYPDSLVGTDSHTTMVNALSVLGWGVGGIEAEAAMLGQPITMNIPKFIGVNFEGKLSEGITATDLVLTVTEKLRSVGVVGSFIEYIGNGLKSITLADRATISNMAPEYGATCGFFSTDEETLKYLELSGRSSHHIKLVKKYTQLQGLWRDDTIKSVYDEIININLNNVEACMAGPKRPQDRVPLKKIAKILDEQISSKKELKLQDNNIDNGSVVMAAITSCTNTSNPNVLIAAGLVAKKAISMGLKSKPWVKTSLAPGSKVVTEYLTQSGLMEGLNKLGFNIVGYGCTTCIGNSGPLNKEISKQIKKDNLTVCSVLSGNRNFEGRIHPEIKANFLASPPLVVIYALVGSINIDITNDPIGKDSKNKNVYLKDIWPSNDEIQQVIKTSISKNIFIEKYRNIYDGDKYWKNIKIQTNPVYKWDLLSTYVKQPPFFSTEVNLTESDIKNARVLAMLGDSITTDHISPAGSIKQDSPAGKYLSDRQVPLSSFNSYGSRRGNHEIMMRGTFANIRLKNELVPGVEGGITTFFENNKKLSIFDAAMMYVKDCVPLIIVAGKEYGTGSSRDWAAKGTRLLGVRAVIAESYERIHRSNLIGMGVIPFEFVSKQSRKSLSLKGNEKFTILGIKDLKPKKIIECKIENKSQSKKIKLLCRIDTMQELLYYKAGGILQYVFNNILKKYS